MKEVHEEAAAVGYRLSLQQRRLWAGWGKARAQALVRLAGPLAAEALHRALDAVMGRHEILRTTFRGIPGMSHPVQVVGTAATPWRWIDLSSLDPDGRRAQLRELLGEDAAAPVDAETGSSLRALLAVCGPEDHLLLLSLPVPCADAPTFALLVEELTAGYAAQYGQGKAFVEEVTQYADFSAWQSEWLASDESMEGRTYWRQRELADLPPPALPWGVATEDAETLLGVEADGPPLAAVESVAASCGTSSFELLLAGWLALLWRSTGVSPSTVGIAVDGRVYEELERALGPISRHLPIVARPMAGTLFADLVKQVGEAVHDASLWQEYYVWEEQADAGRAFPIVFDFLSRPVEHRAGEIRFVCESLEALAETCTLGLFCRVTGDRLRLRVQYAPGLFREEDARRILDHLLALLANALERPQTPLEDLRILPPGERRRILEGFNQTGRPAGGGMLLHQLVEAQAAREPEAVALVHAEGTLTYGALNARANRLALVLRARGVGPEVPVAVAVERSPDMVAAVLAVLKAGGAYVPLDIEAPAARNAFLLADSGARFVVARETSRGDFPVEVLSLDAADLDAGMEPDLPPLAKPENLAYVAYTSGSSGHPKGVLGTHRGAVNYLEFVLRAFALQPGDLVLQVAGLPFDAWIRDCLAPLAAGARVLLLDGVEAKDPATLLARLRGGEVTRALSVVPSLLRSLLAATPEEGEIGDGGSLLTVLASGEPLYGRDLREVRRRLGERVELVNLYGPTECTMTSTFRRLGDADLEAGRLSAGQPLDNVRCFVLDERLEPVPVGVVGEVHIAGEGLTRGYSGRPDLTASSFLPDPHGSGGERLYRTGDLARYHADGVLEILGRRDHQVKVRGMRVELGEVEAALRRHPNVREAVAVLRQGGGGEDALLVAYVTVSPTPGPDSAELRRFLRETLPEAMVPGMLVALDALPRTANGKIDRKALPDPAQAGAREAAADPRTPIEEILASIWEEVLGVERVSPGDDFFDLGGHSLLATQVVARMQSAFGVRLPLRALFDHPALERLALAVEAALEERGVPTPPLTPVAREEKPPLSYAQQRLWFLQRLDPDDTAYNRPHALRIQGALDAGALERGLNEVTRRHEVLRTNFSLEEGVPFQVVHPHRPRPLPLVDLTALPDGPREVEQLRLIAEEGAQPFDLESDPMMRACLLRQNGTEHVLLLTLHHIAGDGWSTGILVREISVLYKSFRVGEPSPLPELPIQYVDFACHQRRVLDEAAIEAELRYWRGQLGEKPPRVRLRPDLPAAAKPRLAARHSLVVAEDVGAAVRTFSRRAGVTPFMTLLAVFNLLLVRYTGEEDLIVLSPIANRDQHEVESLVGFFVNMLPLRTDLSGNPTFHELVERVRETALGAYAHRVLPFEILIDELGLGGSGELPLQIVFALQNMPPPALDLPGVTLELLPVSAEAAKFDLVLGLIDNRERFSGPVFYRADLFSESYIHQMLDHYHDLLGQAMAHPDLRLFDFSLQHEREPLRATTDELYGGLEFNF